MYSYNWYEWMAFFYFYCFFGWCFESIYISLSFRQLINRGFLRGPILPLYGTGAIMMLWISLPFRGNMLETYLSGFIGATTLEYFTGVLMEKIFKVRYWDYSEKKFNFHGYIYLNASIMWGFLTLILTNVIHEPVSNFVTSTDPTLLSYIVIIISALFIFDFINSTRAALDLAHALEIMTKIRYDLEEIQVQISLLRSDVMENASERIGDFKNSAIKRMDGIRDTTSRGFSAVGKMSPFKKLSDIKVEIETKLSEFEFDYKSKPEYRSITERLSSIKIPVPSAYSILTFFKKGLLRGNPDATSKYEDSMRELKETIIKITRKS